jgi:hypothetical protein
MPILSRRILSALSLGALPLAFGAGCSDSDDVSTTVDQGTAQQQSLGAVEVINGMLTSVDEVVAADFSGLSSAMHFMNDLPVDGWYLHNMPEPRSSAEPIYNDEEGRWELAESFSGPQGSAAYYFTVQFTNGSETHQQYPDSTTARTAFGLLFDLDAVSTENGDNIQVDLHYQNGMDITNLDTPVYDVEGAGALTGSIEGTKDGHTLDYDLNMSWALDVDVPADGSCGSGAVFVTIDPYSLVAIYNADSQTYAWSFSQSGTEIASGTGTAPCGTGTRMLKLPVAMKLDP